MYDVKQKAQLQLCGSLAIRFLIASNCVRGGAVTLKNSHRMRGGQHSLKISAPLPLIRTFWMSPLLARSISDSTFKSFSFVYSLIHNKARYLFISNIHTAFVCDGEGLMATVSLIENEWRSLCWAYIQLVRLSIITELSAWFLYQIIVKIIQQITVAYKI